MRRTKVRALGGPRVYKSAIRGRQNGNPRWKLRWTGGGVAAIIRRIGAAKLGSAFVNFEQYNELGDAVLQEYRRARYDEAQFPEIAENALLGFRHSGEFDISAAARLLATTNLGQQASQGSNLPLVVYRVLASLTVGDTTLRRYGAVSYTKNGAFVTCAMCQLWRKCLSCKEIRSNHQQSTAQAPVIRSRGCDRSRRIH